jgi:hypothetical protein
MEGGRKVVSGCLHMHTRYSDGSGTVEELALAAQAAGLDYILITDHMDLRASAHAGRQGELQVMAGYEHHDVDSHNHYLVLGTHGVLPGELHALRLPAAVRNAGGLGIIAHPEEKRRHSKALPPYPWTAWATDEFDGIELWNQMSEWTEHLTRFNQVVRVFSPRKALRGPTPGLLYLWDVLNTRRPVAGVAGVDAHAHAYRLGPMRIPIFPYKVHFRTLQTHVIFDEPAPTDPPAFAREFQRAIRNCRLFFSNERWGPSRGFSLSVETAGASGTIGDALPYTGTATLRARWAGPARYEIVYNGFPCEAGFGDSVLQEIRRPGAYRLALFRRGRGWLYTNHFRLVDG